MQLKKIKIYEVVKKVEDEKEKKVTVERGEASLRLNRLKSDPSKSRIGLSPFSLICVFLFFVLPFFFSPSFFL